MYGVQSKRNDYWNDNISFCLSQQLDQWLRDFDRVRGFLGTCNCWFPTLPYVFFHLVLLRICLKIYKMSLLTLWWFFQMHICSIPKIHNSLNFLQICIFLSNGTPPANICRSNISSVSEDRFYYPSGTTSWEHIIMISVKIQGLKPNNEVGTASDCNKTHYLGLNRTILTNGSFIVCSGLGILQHQASDTSVLFFLLKVLIMSVTTSGSIWIWR